MDPAFHDLVGQVINQTYRVDRRIGAGGMGVVYEVSHLRLGRRLALKLLAGSALTEDSVKRFRREAVITSQLGNAHIVDVIDLNQTEAGFPFIVMELLEGRDLGQVLEQHAPLEIPRVASIVRQASSALQAAHDRGIVHRDLKPPNIFICRRSEDFNYVKVLDFGISKVLSAQTAITRGHEVMGTPGYMAPEQAEGRNEIVDPRTDVFAMGIITYEMLTGARPFEGSSPLSALYEIVHGEARPLKERRPDLPDGVVEVVERALRKKPAERYPTIREFARDLVDAVGGEDVVRTVSAVPLPGERTAPPSQEAVLGDTMAALAGGSTGSTTIKTLAQGEDDDWPEPGAVAVTLAEGRATLLDDTSALEPPELAAEPENHRVLFAGAEGTDTGTWTRLLGAAGHRLSQWAGRATGVWDSDLCVVVLPAQGWKEAWKKRWASLCPPSRTIAAVDAPVQTRGLVGLADTFDHFCIGPAGVDPLPLALALAWLRRPDATGMEHLWVPEDAVENLPVSSSAAKALCVDTLMAAAMQHGLRQRTRHAITEIVEEMVMNAVFHAPVDEDGRPRYAHLDRGSEVTLRPGEQSSLRWAIGERFVAVSVRDPFGSLDARTILSHATSDGDPILEEEGPSGGMGLRLMSRAAHHIVFVINEGRWCEILALVDREPARTARSARTLTVLQNPGRPARRIGDALEIAERPGEGVTHLALVGDINETADLSAVYGRRGEVHVDMSGVRHVNSQGIRVWLRASQAAGADLKVVFERCSPAVVGVLNAVSAVTQHAEVRSILCPFFCERCDSESLELLDLRDVPAEELEKWAGSQICAEPDCPRELDDVFEDYFAFLLED